jgi:voltage-gated potassium channel
VIRPLALVDLLVIITIALGVAGLEGTILRFLRLMRLLRLAKLGHYYRAFSDLGSAIFNRRYELAVSFFVAFVLLLISASALYVVEGEAQPEHFGSIPRAMWWATATLTTVGYGDVVPHTVLGKIFAGMTAVTGIGLIAMPTGILASAFSEVVQSRRDKKESRDVI